MFCRRAQTLGFIFFFLLLPGFCNVVRVENGFITPNYFYSKKESRRFLKTAHEKSNLKYYETTYGTYYNRVKELERFKDVLYGMMPKHERDKFHDEINKLYITGVTTYQVSYNIPAIEQAKKKQTRDAPIDRYSLRRV